MNKKLIMAEILIIGSPNEDKKPQIQLLDSNDSAILLDDLIGYGIIVYNTDDGLIGKYGINLDNFNETNIENVDETTFQIKLPGSIIPQKTGNITGRTVAKFIDNDFEAGYRIDYSKKRQILYTVQRA